MKQIKYMTVGIIILAMVGLSELLGESEIIFPEIAALVTGAWLAEEQPWEVSKGKLVLLMGIASIVGISIVQLPFLLFYKVIIGFIFAGACLLLFRCSLLPIISACILPILMGTESIVYPISVVALCLITVVVQYIFEKNRVRSPRKHIPCNYNIKTELLRWALMTIAIAIVALCSISLNLIYIIAPPLIVTFAELTYKKSSVKVSVKIFILVAVAAVFGALSRLLIVEALHMPKTVAALIATAIVMLAFNVSKKMFPPAGAIALLPFIIPSEVLLLYPIEVISGCGIFIVLAMPLSKIINKGV